MDDRYPLMRDELKRPSEAPAETEDISTDLMQELGRGRKHGSRLAWADFLRNTVVFETIRRSEPLVLVDVGCGSTQWMARWLCGSGLDTQYFGIDAREAPVKAIERMRKGKMAEGFRRLPVGIQHDVAEGLPFVGGSVGFVTCLEAMEHIVETTSQVGDFLDEVQRVLMPSGRFVLATPNRDVGPLQHPHCHGWEGTHEEILRQLRARFQVNAMWTYRARPHVVQGLTRAIRRTDPLVENVNIAPQALNDTIALMAGTADQDQQPPGNMVYICTKAVPVIHSDPPGATGGAR